MIHKIKISYVVLGLLLTSYVTILQPSWATSNQQETEPEIKYFDLSNEILNIFSQIIMDASYNFTAHVYSNTTDSGLNVLFMGKTTILNSNETFHEHAKDNEIHFSLSTKGNSSGFYYYIDELCCGYGGFDIDVTLLTTITSLIVLTIVFRRKP